MNSIIGDMTSESNPHYQKVLRVVLYTSPPFFPSIYHQQHLNCLYKLYNQQPKPQPPPKLNMSNVGSRSTYEAGDQVREILELPIPFGILADLT